MYRHTRVTAATHNVMPAAMLVSASARDNTATRRRHRLATVILSSLNRLNIFFSLEDSLVVNLQLNG